MGAGRVKKEDQIDSKAGIIFKAHIGKQMKKGELIAEIFTDKKEVLDTVSERIQNAVVFSKRKVKEPALIKKILK